MHSFSVNMAMLQYFINIQGSYFNFWVLLNEGGVFWSSEFEPKDGGVFFFQNEKEPNWGGAYSGLKESWNWSC